MANQTADRGRQTEMLTVVGGLRSSSRRISHWRFEGTRLLVTLRPYHIILAMSAPRRPFSLTITAVGIFLLAIWNLWRAWIIAQQSALLEQLDATLDPWVRLGLAILWSVVFLVLALGLQQRRAMVRYVLPAAVFLYGMIHLSLRLLFSATPAARQGWMVQLVLSIAASGWVTWVCLRRAHRDVWSDAGSEGRLQITLSPLTFKVVQRGHDGESKD